jgi:hypothetical protein
MTKHNEIDAVREQRWLELLIGQLREGRFFGTVEIKYANGHVLRIEKHETLLPPTRGRSG